MNDEKIDPILVLQNNYDLIEYMIKNATREQLALKPNEGEQSLGEIIVNMLVHAVRDHDALVENFAMIPVASSKNNNDLDINSIDYHTAFKQFTQYRKKVINLLRSDASESSRQKNRYTMTGKLGPEYFIHKMIESDQIYIAHIRKLIKFSEINPLLSRSREEIRLYHTFYSKYLQESKYVLDIGTGPGRVLQHIRNHHPGITAIGIDIHAYPDRLSSPHLVLYDGIIFPFMDDQFDTSLLFYVLHHCLDPEQLVLEAMRVTRTYLLVIEEYSLPGSSLTSLKLTETQSHAALGIQADLDYRLSTEENFESLFQSHGLTIKEKILLPSKTTRPILKYLYVLVLVKHNN